jgi:carboxylate-amine ligase
VCRTAEEALDTLTGFRSALSREAADRGIVLAGSGLPPVGGDAAGTVTPKSRYRELDAQLRNAAAYQYVTGTHVHVEIPSPDAGVEVLARLAPWAPALLAMTANSPLWCGEPTGFASWRHIMNMSWPVAGFPPDFESGDDYARAVEQLVDSGVLLDSGVVTWLARLSQNYPTMELRIADAQLEAEDAVCFAVLVRALVERALSDVEAGTPRPRATPGLVNGAIWIATASVPTSSTRPPRAPSPPSTPSSAWSRGWKPSCAAPTTSSACGATSSACAAPAARPAASSNGSRTTASRASSGSTGTARASSRPEGPGTRPPLFEMRGAEPLLVEMMNRQSDAPHLGSTGL